MITGTTRPFSQSLKQVRMIIDDEPGSTPFGVNVVVARHQTVLIADTAVTERPDAEQLASIALRSAGFARRMGLEPLIAFKIFDSIRLLQRAMDMLREHCIVGITANEARCRELVEHSIGLVTALNPYIGYENATRIARIALESGRGVLELVREEGLLDDAMLDDILRPENMIAPRLVPLKA